MRKRSFYDELLKFLKQSTRIVKKARKDTKRKYPELLENQEVVK